MAQISTDEEEIPEFLFSTRFPKEINEAFLDRTATYTQLPNGTKLYDEDVEKMMHLNNIFLSTKQVPSCLLMKHTGTNSIRSNVQVLRDAGFTLEVLTSEGIKVLPPTSVFDGASKTGLSTLSMDSDSFMEHIHGDLPQEDETFEEDELYQTKGRIKDNIRIRYCDPFAAMAAMEAITREKGKKPNFVVWSGDICRLTDVIPYRVLNHYGYETKSKRGCDFITLSDIKVKLAIILNHTHFGSAINKSMERIVAAKKELREPEYLDIWIGRTWNLIKDFLKGKTNSLWPAHLRKHGSSENSMRERSIRFLQVLRTIDGVFLQKFIAYPDSRWTWKRFDLFVIGLIRMLLPDEFLGGELSEKLLEVKAGYEILQNLRKGFKDAYNRKCLDRFVNENERKPLIYRVFEVEYKRIQLESDAYYNLQIAGILGQKRGAGTPPPYVALKNKIKFLKTITTPPVAITEEEKVLIDAAMNEFLVSTPDYAFTGLTTKAGVRISSNACYEKTRKEGGTIGMINQIVSDGRLGRPAYKIDLNNGEDDGQLSLEEPGTSIGEYIFWRCLEEVLAMTDEQLEVATMIGVQEPGKTRVITKSAACLKVVLDVVHGICAWPLGKVESSESGMTKDNHGWNFFKEFFHHKELVFKVKASRKRENEHGYIEENTYEDVYVSSTDYQTATDFLQLDIAKKLANPWMRKCGIPGVLRGIVNRVCFRPRRVRFFAKGMLTKYGRLIEGNIYETSLIRGVLMGDPLTKVILHLINIIVRKLGIQLTNYLGVA